MVQDQYEDYPYPYRNPQDEYKRLLAVEGEYLGEINHWLFKGKEAFQLKFKILIAGGGTGDALIYLAHQLKNTNAEIVYLDFSQASLKIAKERTEIRGLKNITWICDDLLNIPNLNLGKFDFINCSGVLHHLGSPSHGLNILKSLLSDKGGMNIMIYAKYGRTGVYHIQELMKRVNINEIDKVNKIENTKSILSVLPESNWFKLSNNLFNDITNSGDIGIYDLFLHQQDRCYSIPEMYELIEERNLNFIEFSTAKERISLKIERYIKDESLLLQMKKLTPKNQQAICEMIKGDIIKHTFYVSNNANTVAELEDLNNVPYFYNMGDDSGVQIAHLLESYNIISGQNLTINLSSVLFRNLSVTIDVGCITEYILKNINNDRSLAEIVEFIRKEKNQNISEEFFISEVRLCLMPFIEAGVILLRDKSIGKFNFI